MRTAITIAVRLSGLLAALSVLTVVAGPALTSILATVVVTIGAMCWVLADAKRVERLAMLIEVTQTGKRRQQPKTIAPRRGRRPG